MWNAKSIHGILIGKDSNWQLLKVEHFDLKFLIFNIYGPTSTNDKKNLWVVLTNLIQQEREMNFILGGDFNALLSMTGKKGGICAPIRTIQGFSSFVEDNNLSDIFPYNGLYTWTNRRIGFLEIAERLDRFLFSQSWNLLSFSLKSEILPFAISDHFPVQLLISKNISQRLNQASSFKFEHMCYKHPDFIMLLKYWWINAPTFRDPKMLQFSKKLRYMKGMMKE